MKRNRLKPFLPLAVLLLMGAGGSTASSKSSKAENNDAYVIVTDSEATPEDLLERYPEISGSWRDLAQFNLLRTPGTTIEMSRDMLSADSRLAKIFGLYGEAEIKRSFDDRFIPLVENLLLREGDVLRTWRHAGARILFDDGNYVVLRSHSRARLVSLSPTRSSQRPEIRLELMEGLIWSRTQGKVKGDFIIETPTAQTIVRGTDFRLKIEAGDATRLEVLDGTVELLAGGQSVSVPARRGILSIAGEEIGSVEVLPSAPAELLEPKPKQVVRATSFDQTFRWMPVPGATAYRLEIASDEGFIDLAAERKVGPEPTVRITGLEPGTYFWRVSALNANGFEGEPAGDSYFVFVQERR